MIIEVNKNNKNINKQQNAAIAALQRKVASLKMLSAMPKKARRQVAKRTRISAPKHPLHAQAVALLKPFSVSPGVAQHLIDALPSQKYTVRSRLTAQAGNGGSLFGFLSPYAWIDSDTPSGMVISMTTGTLESSTVRIFNDVTAGSNVTPATSTRYDFTPVRPHSAGEGRTARLVSYGFKVRYTGTALNANGTFKLLACPHGEFEFDTQATYGGVISRLQGSLATQNKSVYDKAVYEYNFIGNNQWSTIGTGADQDEVSDYQRVGQASSSKYSAEPGCVFYYANNSSSAVQFELELIEHWEVRGSNIAPFYTDSHTAPDLHHEIMNVVNTAHAKAGLSTESKFVNVVSTVARASKSPIGKAVLAAALA